jgi:hypothetical protein
MGFYDDIADELEEKDAPEVAEEVEVEAPEAEVPEAQPSTYDGIGLELEPEAAVDSISHRTVAETSTPDSEAEVADLSEQTGVDASLVRDSLPAAKNVAEHKRINKTAENLPG